MNSKFPHAQNICGIMPFRMGRRPVRAAVRVGVQEGSADIRAQVMPSLASELILGVSKPRGDLNASFGEAPFYARPYVQLRGVPALRYQGEIATSVEAELRWRFWKRFSLIAFGGIGLAGNDWDDLELGDAVFAGGGGFRYELARRYGLHVGVSEEDTALYITFGSAWMRP